MILFLITLLLATLCHEFAHFFVAKMVKCPIEIVSIGFGKILFQFKHNKILYQIRLFLFGGDCQLKGERVYLKSKDAFCNLPYKKKAYILLAGCFTNIIIGMISLLIGNLLNNYCLLYFGLLNIFLGLGNLLPIPCLDGSCLVFIWLVKFMGKKRGYNLFIKINKIALKFWIVTNILCIPWIIYLLIKGII